MLVVNIIRVIFFIFLGFMLAAVRHESGVWTMIAVSLLYVLVILVFGAVSSIYTKIEKIGVSVEKVNTRAMEVLKKILARREE